MEKMMLDGTDMLEFVFLTYVLALIAVVISLYVWYELSEYKKMLRNKPKTKVQPKPPVVVKRPKGHWD